MQRENWLALDIQDHPVVRVLRLLVVLRIFKLIRIAIFIYVNLEVGCVIRPVVKRKNAMRAALGVWLIAIALGINIYLTVYYA